MQDEKEASGSITVFDDMDKAYDFVESKGIYKYIVLAGTILAYLTHMFLLFSYPFFLIKPTAYCDISGHFKECTKEEICETTDREVNYYFKVPHEFNLITEFDWYCESMTSSYYTGTSFFVGTAVSALIVTALSDAVGRVPLLVVGVVGNIVTIVLFMFHATPITCLLTSFFAGGMATALWGFYDGEQLGAVQLFGGLGGGEAQGSVPELAEHRLGFGGGADSSCHVDAGAVARHVPHHGPLLRCLLPSSCMAAGVS